MLGEYRGERVGTLLMSAEVRGKYESVMLKVAGMTARRRRARRVAVLLRERRVERLLVQRFEPPAGGELVGLFRVRVLRELERRAFWVFAGAGNGVR